MPAELLRTVSGGLGEAEHAHSFVVKRIGFGEIEDVELDGQVLTRVANTEEKPLGMPVRVDVVLKDQVVFVVADFHCAEQVASLEARLEHKRAILGSVGHVVRNWWLVFLFHGRLACGLQLVEVFAFALDVVIFHKLFHVDEVRRNLAHGLRQVWIVNQVECLLGNIVNVVAPESAVDHVAVFVHHRHVVLDVVRGGSQSRNFGFQLNRELLGFFFRQLHFGSGLATFFLRFVTAPHQMGQTDERNRSARLNRLIVLEGRLRYELQRRRQIDVFELTSLKSCREVFNLFFFVLVLVLALPSRTHLFFAFVRRVQPSDLNLVGTIVVVLVEGASR